MANNYLITGYHGEPHVTSENERGINAGIFGAGRFVLPVGAQFQATYMGNNTVRLYDGKLIDNGAIAGIPVDQYIDLTIPEAGQGKSRNDLIIFMYRKDTNTLVESGSFVVFEGEEVSGIATDPEIQQKDLLWNTNVDLDMMPLWRIPVTGSTIGEPQQLFTLSLTPKDAVDTVERVYKVIDMIGADLNTQKNEVNTKFSAVYGELAVMRQTIENSINGAIGGSY